MLDRVCSLFKNKEIKSSYIIKVFYNLASWNFFEQKVGHCVYLNYFASKRVLAKILKNPREKYVLAVYFDRKDLFEAGN